MARPHSITLVSSYMEGTKTRTLSRKLWLREPPETLLDPDYFLSNSPFSGMRFFSTGEVGPKNVSRFGEGDAQLVIDHLAQNLLFMSGTGFRPARKVGRGMSGDIGHIWRHKQTGAEVIVQQTPKRLTFLQKEGTTRFAPEEIGTGYQSAIDLDLMISAAVEDSLPKAKAEPVRRPAPLVSEPKTRQPSKPAPRYPRTGALALGDSAAFGRLLEKSLAANARERKRGLPTNMAVELAGLLEDAFQCGVITQDRSAGRRTDIPKSRDRTLMHKARASHILKWSGSNSRRDDEELEEFMMTAGKRAYADGVRFARTGVLNLAPLFDFEASRLWREVPSRYSDPLYAICNNHFVAQKHKLTGVIKFDDRHDIDKWRGEYTQNGKTVGHDLRESLGLRYVSLTDAGVRALVSQGFLLFDDNSHLHPTPEALAAFQEHAPAYEASSQRVKRERQEELKRYGYFTSDTEPPLEDLDRTTRCKTWIGNRFVGEQVYPCHPRRHLPDKLPVYFTCTGHVASRTDGVLVDTTSRGIPVSDSITGLKIILALLQMPDMQEAPYERERGWRPMSTGFGSDVFRHSPSGADIHLQKIGQKTKPGTIQKWEQEESVRFRDLCDLPSGNRFTLFAEARHEAVLEEIKQALMTKLAQLDEPEPEDGPNPY